MRIPKTESTQRRLLIADDQPSLLSWARRAFLRAGWDVITAEDGATAWHMWQQACDAGETPHLLMTDLNMPGLNGGALMERVRSVSPQTPILVVTGLAADQAVWNVSAPARTMLVRKPVSGSDLILAATALVHDCVAQDSTRLGA